MKTRFCVVCNNKTTNVLHSVPVGNLVMRKLWIDFIDSCAPNDGLNFDRKSRIYVCSQHFMDNDYNIGGTGKRYLRHDAVPSIICSTIETNREEYIYDEVEVKEQEIILNLEDDNIANVATVSFETEQVITSSAIVEPTEDNQSIKTIRDVKKCSNKMVLAIEKLKNEFMLERRSLKEAASECFTHKGFVYIQASGVRKNREGKCIKYLRCRRYREPWHCIGTAIVYLKSGKVIVNTPEHNHGPEDAYQEDKEFRQFLKYIALRIPGTTGQLYKCAAKHFPNAATRITLKRIRASMTAWRRAFISPNVIKNKRTKKVLDNNMKYVIEVNDQTSNIPPLVYYKTDALTQVITKTKQTVLNNEPEDHDYSVKATDVPSLQSWLPSLPDTEIGSSCKHVKRLLECKICIKNRINHTFSCGHMTCGTCAAKIYNSLAKCPVCQETFTTEPHILHFE